MRNFILFKRFRNPILAELPRGSSLFLLFPFWAPAFLLESNETQVESNTNSQDGSTRHPIACTHTHTSEVGGGACARCCIHMSHELSNKYMFRVVFVMIVMIHKPPMLHGILMNCQ